MLCIGARGCEIVEESEITVNLHKFNNFDCCEMPARIHVREITYNSPMIPMACEITLQKVGIPIYIYKYRSSKILQRPTYLKT